MIVLMFSKLFAPPGKKGRPISVVDTVIVGLVGSFAAGFLIMMLFTLGGAIRSTEQRKLMQPTAVVRVCTDGSAVYRYPDGRLRWGGYIVEDIEKFCLWRAE